MVIYTGQTDTTIYTVQPISELDGVEPGTVMDMNGVRVRACWYNLYLGDLVPGDSPAGESEYDYPSLWWVAGLD